MEKNQASRKAVRALRQIALFVFALAVALTLLEVGFRLARREEPFFDRLGWGEENKGVRSAKIYEKTNEFEFAAAVNSHGFRGPEISVEKPQGIKRLVILGDSFIFGWGVNDDQVFSYRIEKEINKGQRRLEVVNASGGSLSPLTYYVKLKNELMKFQPDLVLTFLNYADLREDYFYKRNIIRDSENHIAEINPLYIDGRLDFWRWLRNKSEFCSYTYNKISRTLRKIEIVGLWDYIKVHLKGGRARDIMFEKEQAARRNKSPIEYDPYFMFREGAAAEETEKYLDETGQYLSMIHELLRQRNVPLALAVLPNGAQVGPNQWKVGRKAWGFEPGKVYENPSMTQWAEAFAQKRGVGFVDLLPFFRKAADQPLFFDQDGHLTAHGHAALAQGLLASLDFSAD